MMRILLIFVSIILVTLSYTLTWATGYRLTGRVIEQDMGCEAKPAQAIDQVQVTSECEIGGPSGATNNFGEYELNYQCGTCVNMVIYFEKAGYMPEVRRIRSDMTNSSLGDITLRKIEKHSDYRFDDIISLFLTYLETEVWIDWRDSQRLNKFRSIWKEKIYEILEDKGKSFQEVINTYPSLYDRVQRSLSIY